MKKLILFLFALLAYNSSAQSIIGGWEMKGVTAQGDSTRSILIFAEGYQVLTTYNLKTGDFMSTNGGTWSLNGNTMTEKVEFATENPEMVGQEFSFEIEYTANTLSIVGTGDVLNRIDNGTEGALSGAWLMSGRKRNGEIQSRDTTRPRKTMKILSGTRFQWIAYDTEKKTFSGSGGGTYTTVDGVYTENIEFFSRDVTRVGASLNFDFELVDGAWHHSGLSSKGSPIYEIWSKRK